MTARIHRALSLIIGLLGVVLYLFFCWDWSIEWRQSGYAERPFLEQLWFVIDYAVFLSGLPPVMLAVYFLIIKRSASANTRGLIYVALFIPAHFYVAAITAHSPVSIYLPVQLVELLAAIALIWTWKERPPAGLAAT